MPREFRGSRVIIANPILGYWRSWKLKFENHFKIYKDVQVNEFFWSFCFLGGCLKTKKISKIFKKIWVIWNISSLIILLGINIACLIWYEEKNNTTYTKLSRPILSMISVFSGHALCYLSTDSIEKYMDSMDKRIETESMAFDKDAVEYNEKMVTFVIISFIQFLTTLKISIAIYCMVNMMIVYMSMGKRTFGCYLKRIANTGSWTLQQMENNHNEELLMEQNESHEIGRTSEEFAKQRNAIEDNFEKEMAYFAKQMWSLIRIHENLRELFENGCTALLFTLYTITLPMAGQLIWVVHHPSDLSVLILNAATHIFINGYIFYKFCWVGTQSSEVMDRFPIEIYSTPWYMMSKKTRRTVCILLAQTQIEHRIRVFNTTPINVRLFYRFVDSLYSNGSVIHSILNSQK